jgi:hypothetical protein
LTRSSSSCFSRGAANGDLWLNAAAMV